MPEGPARRRDAARSREQLLTAAGELFAERGYDRTTLREVGERAGVDPALVARYYGSKAALYLAALRAEVGDEPAPDLLAPGRLAALLARLRRRGPGPVVQSALQQPEEEGLHDAVREHLTTRLVAPLHDRFAADGRDRALLRAEVAVAAFAGVAAARRAGLLAELAAAGDEELADLVLDLVQGLSVESPHTDGEQP